MDSRNFMATETVGLEMPLARSLDVDTDADLAAAELFQKLFGPPCRDAQHEIWKAATEPVSKFRYPDLRQIRRNAEPEFSADDALGRQSRLEIIQHAEHPSPLRIGFAARRRRLQGLRLPVEQRRAEPLFQVLDPPGDTRLGQVQARRGRHDRAGFHNRNKGFKVRDIHAELA